MSCRDVRKTTSIFFFPAEDGLRHPLVTGVQTCALPISREPFEIFRRTEKIVPTGTLTSMFDDPSSGSNSRQYFPQRKGSGIWMMPGSSSEAIAHKRPP